MKRNVLVMQFERGINQLNKFGVAGKSIIEIRIPQITPLIQACQKVSFEIQFLKR